MSLSVQQTEFTDPFVLALVELALPEPAAGEVRVRVRAAGLNPVDWKIASSPQLAEMFGVTLPAGFGNDFAGEVDAVGEGVESLKVGDRVFGGARGRAVAEHVVVNATDLTRTPDAVDDVHAAALDVAGRTADAVVNAVRVAQGDTVLVGSGAGGVGVLVVQLAVSAGATVIATASENNHEFLRSLGAIPTTHGEGLEERVRVLAPEGVDAAIDLHGTDTASTALALGVAADRIATIAAYPPVDGVISTGATDSTAGALARIAQGLADGSLVLPIAQTFPIQQIDDAVALQRTGHVRGKIVITIA